MKSLNMILNKAHLKEYVNSNQSVKSEAHLLFLTKVQKESLILLAHHMGMSMNEFIRRSMFIAMKRFEEEVC